MQMSYANKFLKKSRKSAKIGKNRPDCRLTSFWFRWSREKAEELAAVGTEQQPTVSDFLGQVGGQVTFFFFSLDIKRIFISSPFPFIFWKKKKFVSSGRAHLRAQVNPLAVEQHTRADALRKKGQWTLNDDDNEPKILLVVIRSGGMATHMQMISLFLRKLIRLYSYWNEFLIFKKIQ